MTNSTASYLTTSRRVYSGRRREDVHHRRPGDRLRGVSQRGVWADLLDLDNDVKRGPHERSSFVVHPNCL